MNKSDSKEALSKELNLPLQTASNIINTIIQTMIDTPVNGDHIEIRGFGSFTVRHYDSYTGRNPKTREKVVVEAKKLPAFRVGKELREAVYGGRK